MNKPKFKTFSEVLTQQLKEITQEELDRKLFKIVRKNLIKQTKIKNV